LDSGAQDEPKKTRTFAFFWRKLFNKFFSKITYKGYFHARNRLRTSKNLENASLTPNQSKNKLNIKKSGFWGADLGSGKPFSRFFNA
jgi:hypothetical protein